MPFVFNIPCWRKKEKKNNYIPKSAQNNFEYCLNIQYKISKHIKYS